ncbi:MAG: aminopeptidase P family protein [Candidatus Nanopelagicales bacterium]
MDYSGRRGRLREQLGTAGLDALLVTYLTNVRYLTGFTGSNGAVLVTADPALDRLGTDFRYLTQSGLQSPDLELVLNRDCAAAMASYAREAGISRLGFEADRLSVAAYDQLQTDQVGTTTSSGPGERPDPTAPAGRQDALTLVRTAGLVEALRTVKDADELALLAQACGISDAALAQVCTEVRAGMTERQVARRLDALMLDLGAEAISFDTIVAAGPNSAIPHHSPTDRPIAAGDLLKIDFGALCDGYHADETRTFVVGAEPAHWQREIYDLVAQAQLAGVAALAVGVDVRDVDHAARSIIAAAGHAEHFGHGLGHGVGLDIHEAPTIGYAGTGNLADGTPVTVEPGVYLPGRGGVRIEDTLVVRAGGPESLTTTTRELLVL